MLLTPNMGDVKVITNSGLVGTATPGTAVPDNATINLYGAVTELISAANNVRDSWAIAIDVIAGLSPSAIITDMSLDILIGGATDDTLISSLLVGGSFFGNSRSFWFPIHIPGGVRIAARLSAGALQSPEPQVIVNLYGGTTPPFQIGRKVTTYGTKASNSRGLAVTPAASGGAATVTEMTASSTEDHFYFLPGFQVSTDSSIVGATAANIGIGIGAATEERIGTWWFTKNASEMQSGPHPNWGVYRDVPSGTRLTMLASQGSALDLAHDGHIYAVS